MRVGINLLYMIPGAVGGTETYAAGLLHGLAQIDTPAEFYLFLNQEAEHWPLPGGGNFTRIVCPVRARSRCRRYGYEQFAFPRLLKRLSVDIVHSLGYVAPLRVPCPSVVSIPDMNHRALRREMGLLRSCILGCFVRQSALRSDCIIAISEFGRSEITDGLNVPSGKVIVAHLAPKNTPEMAPRGLGEHGLAEIGIRTPYLLAYSSQSHHKNISGLLQAFALARVQAELPHRLVIVGHQPPGSVLVETVRQLDLGNAVVFTGYLEEDVLQSVLRNAQMLAFPSFYEGFGLPVLEAMASGVPVVCSNRASLPEVAGSAARFFDPSSTEDIARAIVEVATSQEVREELREKGFENLKRFSWETTARKTLAIYEKVCETAEKPEAAR